MDILSKGTTAEGNSGMDRYLIPVFVWKLLAWMSPLNSRAIEQNIRFVSVLDQPRNYPFYGLSL